MTGTIHLTSFAKVNYTLDVLSLRADGFHNLASVMQTVSLGDRVTLRCAPGSGISLECEAPDVPADSTNLAWRAAAAALTAAGRSGSIHIRIDKRVPTRAGLGGGSSNAATVLRGLNSLMQLNLPHEELVAIGVGLGSDVPFFLVGGTAAVRGRGESVTPLPDGPPFWLVLVKPDIGVSTASAYAALDALPGRVSARATRSMEDDLADGCSERIVARMINDFEQVVFEQYPAVALVHDDLLMARAHNARLCGSGAAVFGLAYDRDEAEQIARMMRLKYAQVMVCRAVGRNEAAALPAGSRP